MELFNLRQVYVDELINQAKRDKRIVCLDSDSKEATLIDKFCKKFKNRSFSVGIAEQNMVSLAGGMSTIGLIPFVNSYGMFIAMRALDQVRNSIAYPNFNVKFILSHHGLDSGQDGVTHQLTEDIAIFRTIPNIKLLQPADSIEMKQMVRFAVKTKGPIIIKSGKSKVSQILFYFKNGDFIAINVTDWSKELTQKNGWTDNLGLSLRTTDLNWWLVNKAFK